MLNKDNLIRLLLVLLFVVVGDVALAATSALPSAQLHLTDDPSWIKPQTPNYQAVEPQDQLQDGVFYLLYDHQIQFDGIGTARYYKRFVEKIVATKGLENLSTIKIDFDPNYQQVLVHRVNIIRDGKSSSIFSKLKISVLNREQELENSIYNGLFSYHLIIPDLRVGDIIDYSYSIIGNNPIYHGHFSGMEYLDWSVPIAKQHFLIDWRHDNKKLYFKLDNAKIEPTVTLNSGFPVYEIVRELEPLKKYNSQSPAWHNVYQRIYYSDIDSWDGVVQWAIPLYEAAIKISPDVQLIADNIKRNSKTEFEVIAQALHYVQSEIRYLGIEIGVNSHKPSDASETLARRYGDCKDKAVLLITLFRALGVNSTVALVNTDEQKEIRNRIPSVDVFNHVIVRVNVAGTIFWLDPTHTYQRGSLSELSQSDFGFALVIAEKENSLQQMNSKPRYQIKIEENIDASHEVNKPVFYKVNTQYLGREAEYERFSFSDSNLEVMADKYLNFYRDYYPKIKLLNKLELKDSKTSDELETNESYSIEKFWKEDPKGKFTASFYASGISSAIPKPDEKIRVQPFKIDSKEISEVLSIKLESLSWSFPNEEKNVDNEFFNFSFKANFNKSTDTLTLAYHYKTLVKFVPANKIDEYLDFRDKARDLAEYSIYQTLGDYSSNQKSDENIWIWGLLIFYFIAFIVFIICWYFDSDRKQLDPDIDFYPVSVNKYLIVGLLTAGIYPVYWMYRNWKQIGLKEKSSLFPFWRGIFYIIFIYSFLRRVIFHGGWIKGKYSAIAAYSYSFFVIFLVILDAILDWQIFFIVAQVLVLLVLVISVNRICAQHQSILLHHSKIKLKHYAFIAMCVPILILMLGQDLGYFPSDNVVPGSKLMQRDLKYLHRNKIISASEKITFFYSSEALDKLESGCGFSQKSVFNYWHDEYGQLQFNSFKFSEIKTIDVQSGDAWFDNKTIVIILKDDTEVSLYIPSTGKSTKAFIKQLYDNWQASE